MADEASTVPSNVAEQNDKKPNKSGLRAWLQSFRAPHLRREDADIINDTAPIASRVDVDTRVRETEDKNEKLKILRSERKKILDIRQAERTAEQNEQLEFLNARIAELSPQGRDFMAHVRGLYERGRARLSDFHWLFNRSSSTEGQDAGQDNEQPTPEDQKKTRMYKLGVSVRRFFDDKIRGGLNRVKNDGSNAIDRVAGGMVEDPKEQYERRKAKYTRMKEKLNKTGIQEMRPIDVELFNLQIVLSEFLKKTTDIENMDKDALQREIDSVDYVFHRSSFAGENSEKIDWRNFSRDQAHDLLLRVEEELDMLYQIYGPPPRGERMREFVQQRFAEGQVTLEQLSDALRNDPDTQIAAVVVAGQVASRTLLGPVGLLGATVFGAGGTGFREQRKKRASVAQGNQVEDFRSRYGNDRGTSDAVSSEEQLIDEIEEDDDFDEDLIFRHQDTSSKERLKDHAKRLMKGGWRLFGRTISIPETVGFGIAFGLAKKQKVLNEAPVEQLFDDIKNVDNLDVKEVERRIQNLTDLLYAMIDVDLLLQRQPYEQLKEVNKIKQIKDKLKIVLQDANGNLQRYLDARTDQGQFLSDRSKRLVEVIEVIAQDYDQFLQLRATELWNRAIAVKVLGVVAKAGIVQAAGAVVDSLNAPSVDAQVPLDQASDNPFGYTPETLDYTVDQSVPENGLGATADGDKGVFGNDFTPKESPDFEYVKPEASYQPEPGASFDQNQVSFEGGEWEQIQSALPSELQRRPIVNMFKNFQQDFGIKLNSDMVGRMEQMANQYDTVFPDGFVPPISEVPDYLERMDIVAQDRELLEAMYRSAQGITPADGDANLIKNALGIN